MTKLTDRKNALEQLKNIDLNKESYYIIHYSCERFNNETGTSPRITSIAIRDFLNAQTILFSLHKTAEELSVPFNKIKEDIDRIEKEMLKNYFKLVKDKQKDKYWIHWNMRDTNYGFKAIEHRYSVLGGKPSNSIIDDSKKIDLSGLLIKLFDKGYASHPRIEKLMEKNNISSPPDFLSGSKEADAYDNNEYNKIMMSTSRKVDIFSNFLNLTINNNLKVYTPKWKWYGVTFKGIWTTFRNSIWFVPISWSVSAILGALVSRFIDKI